MSKDKFGNFRTDETVWRDLVNDYVVDQTVSFEFKIDDQRKHEIRLEAEAADKYMKSRHPTYHSDPDDWEDGFLGEELFMMFCNAVNLPYNRNPIKNRPDTGWDFEIFFRGSWRKLDLKTVGISWSPWRGKEGPRAIYKFMKYDGSIKNTTLLLEAIRNRILDCEYPFVFCYSHYLKEEDVFEFRLLWWLEPEIMLEAFDRKGNKANNGKYMFMYWADGYEGKKKTSLVSRAYILHKLSEHKLINELVNNQKEVPEKFQTANLLQEGEN